VINLETPKKFAPLVAQANQVAREVLRPISRKYDREEHTRPKELDMLAALIDGMNDSGELGGTGAAGVRRDSNGVDANPAHPVTRNGSNLSTVLSIMELCWGDVGLLLSMPRQGLGNSAIASVANDEQLERFAGRWAAMAITEPEAGSDSAAIRTTAVLDGDEYVLNGEKIYVTAGERADLVVVWASLDRTKGRAAIKSFVVERSNPGMKLIRTEDKLGIRASDTAELLFEGCRVPTAQRLGAEGQGFAIAMKTLDGGRIGIAAQAVGIAAGAYQLAAAYARERSSFGVRIADHQMVQWMLADMATGIEAARLLTLRAAWLKDQGEPYGPAAAMAKLFASETAMKVTTDAVQVHGGYGYIAEYQVERYFRDAKITQIYEGTSQIQKLVIARHLLNPAAGAARRTA
jgi:acyl-CoA dehydrogenase